MSLAPWSEFVLAFLAFFVSHSIPLRPVVKGWFIRHIGSMTFTVTYSLLSLTILGWLVVAAGRAPYVELWPREDWQNWVAVVGMSAAIFVAAQAIGRPNPFSFGGGKSTGFKAESPGIVGWVRHPLLFTLSLWAGVHLLANGDLAHGLLFGIFLVFSVLGRSIIDRRKRRNLGADQWQTLWEQTQSSKPALWQFSLPRILIAGVITSGLVFLHPIVLGVSPLPY